MGVLSGLSASAFRNLLRYHHNFRSVATMAQEKYNVVFVLGPPGSGKGTQCQRISDKYGYVHLSAGDLLRAERQRQGSTYGEMIETHITNGTIVPVEVTCALLENAMKASGDAAGFLIDGFPRNEDNNEGWNKQMSSKVDLKFVLFIECATEVCLQRCLSRGQGRTDDNEESLKKRIVTYNTQTMPIVNIYEALGKVRKADGTQGPDKVFEQVSSFFDALKSS